MSVHIDRIFHPVGHGAFYTECFSHDNHSPFFRVVFDCGCYESAKKGESIKTFENRINSLIDSTFQQGDSIDILFVSHFHLDHIIGLRHLFERCVVKLLVLPQIDPISTIEVILHNLSDISDENDDEIEYAIQLVKDIFRLVINRQEACIEVSPDPEVFSNETLNQHNLFDEIKEKVSFKSGVIFNIDSIYDWVYVPFFSTIPSSFILDLKKEFKQSSLFSPIIRGDNWNIGSLLDLASRGTLDELKRIYRSVFGNNQNNSSMIVFSGRFNRCSKYCEKICRKQSSSQPRYCTLNCLYTGDANLTDKQYQRINAFNGDLMKYTGLIQVPHHGSKENHNKNLYSFPKVSIISSGINDKYGLPNQEVIDDIQSQGSMSLVVNENPKTAQHFHYKLTQITI